MTNKIKMMLAGLLMVPALAVAGAAVVPTDTVYAQEGGIRGGSQAAQDPTVPENIDQDDGLIKRVVNILLFIIGAIAVIMLIIGGIRYTISGGDQSQVTAAKNTILYAIVGIIVAIFAYAIVNFVLDEFLN